MIPSKTKTKTLVHNVLSLHKSKMMAVCLHKQEERLTGYPWKFESCAVKHVWIQKFFQKGVKSEYIFKSKTCSPWA